MVQLPLTAVRRQAPSSCVLEKLCISKEAVEEVFEEYDGGMPRVQIERLEDTFVIDEILGAGGFGIVRKASLKSRGVTTAVKTLSKSGRIAEAMAQREIRILARLVHLNICALLNVYEDSQHIHLELEYAQGHELFEEILPENPMKEARAAQIMRQVLEALRYCHNLQPVILHRDVKPENIMVQDDICPRRVLVKLIDWGLATECHGEIETPIVGTACYMSPEALSVGLYSSASDMWSAGAVTHAMLTGGAVPPQFKTADLPGNRTGNIELHKASKLGKDFLRQLLSHNPACRPSAEAATQDQWILAATEDKQCCEVPSTTSPLETNIQHETSSLPSRKTKAVALPLGSGAAACTIHADSDFEIFVETELDAVSEHPFATSCGQTLIDKAEQLPEKHGALSKTRKKKVQRSSKENIGPGYVGCKGTPMRCSQPCEVKTSDSRRMPATRGGHAR